MSGSRATFSLYDEWDAERHELSLSIKCLWYESSRKWTNNLLTPCWYHKSLTNSKHWLKTLQFDTSQGRKRQSYVNELWALNCELWVWVYELWVYELWVYKFMNYEFMNFELWFYELWVYELWLMKQWILNYELMSFELWSYELMNYGWWTLNYEIMNYEITNYGLWTMSF